MPNNELNLVYKWLRIALIFLCVLLGVWALSGLKSLGSIDPAYNSITVSGEGEAVAIPDIASFSFQVSADDKTVALAQEAVAKKVDAVLAALNKLGVADKDIKTTDYSAYPKYVYNTIYCFTVPCPQQQTQDGYTVTHSITVKLHDTTLAGQALQVAGDNGASNLSGLSFTVDKPEAVTAEARDMAIAKAKTKAESLAKSLGVRLVRVVSYSDSTGGSFPITYMKDAAVSADSRPAPTIPAGENKVNLTVSITYEIR